MLDCRTVLEQLSEYLDDSVSAEVCRALEEHLSRCQHCSVVYDTARRALRIVSNVGAFEVPLGASARLYLRLEKAYAGQ